MGREYEATVLDLERESLLTTTEAAKLLGVSRQHIVDLCDRGDLPFIYIGTHRRINRADLESLKVDSSRMTRDQRRSLWLSYAVAGELVRDPELTIDRARSTLQRLKSERRPNKWLSNWDRLLDGPVDEVLRVLTSPSKANRELRQNSPFTFALSGETRDEVLRSFARFDLGDKR